MYYGAIQHLVFIVQRKIQKKVFLLNIYIKVEKSAKYLMIHGIILCRLKSCQVLYKNNYIDTIYKLCKNNWIVLNL